MFKDRKDQRDQPDHKVQSVFPAQLDRKDRKAIPASKDLLVKLAMSDQPEYKGHKVQAGLPARLVQKDRKDRPAQPASKD